MERIFEREEMRILEEVEHFYKLLTRLRYEGKVSRARNVKASKEAITTLMGTLKRHRDLEEKIIFPFLLSHLPKHESVIRFLRSDHEDIRKNKERLYLWLKDLLKESRASGIDGKVQETGVYLTCLVRHHMELEKENIHKAIKEELKPSEKKEIAQHIRKWFQKQNNWSS